MARFLIGIAGMAGLLMATGNYRESIRHWQAHRDAGLRSPDGWLTLVGLFWLNPGDNSIGSADDNNLALPKDSTPAHVGTLKLDGEKVVFIQPNGTSRVLRVDDEKPDVIRAGNASFYVIKRVGRFAVRLKDSASPVLRNFTGMKYFPINPEFHFQAKFIPVEKKIPIINVQGQSSLERSPGLVEFDYQGHAYRLRPIFEGKTLFFLFKDATNRMETYQAGRMLNTPLPVNGRVDLDFNRSYNPPCTFTPYATCPLPPKENTLTFPVEAGELRYRQGHVEYTAEH
jgi:uncharacterized protein